MEGQTAQRKIMAQRKIPVDLHFLHHRHSAGIANVQQRSGGPVPASMFRVCLISCRPGTALFHISLAINPLQNITVPDLRKLLQTWHIGTHKFLYLRLQSNTTSHEEFNKDHISEHRNGAACLLRSSLIHRTQTDSAIFGQRDSITLQ